MTYSYKKDIAELLMRIELIEMGYTDGSTMEVYKSIIGIVDEMESKMQDMQNTIESMEDTRTPIKEGQLKIKHLENELNQYKFITLDLVDEINRLRNGISKPIKHYKEIETLIDKRNEIRTNI